MRTYTWRASLTERTASMRSANCKQADLINAAALRPKSLDQAAKPPTRRRGLGDELGWVELGWVGLGWVGLGWGERRREGPGLTSKSSSPPASPSLVTSPAQPLHPAGSLSKLELEGSLLVMSTFRSTSCRGPSLSMSDAH